MSRRCLHIALCLVLLNTVLNQSICFGNTYKTDGKVEFSPNTRMMRGINIGSALEAPREGEWGVYIMDEYFSIIKNAGFDTVRIPIRWSAHAEEYPPYRIYDEFFQRVDHVVNVSLRQGLITIINIHHYEEIMSEPEKHRNRFLSIWRQIAEHYSNYPENLYFEILNEPHSALTAEIWNSLMKEAVEIIRESNPSRKIIIGPADWNSVYKLKDLKLPDDKNIIVTFHFYTPFEFTHQGAEWASPAPPVGRKWVGTPEERKQIVDELDIAANWAREHNVTLLMGEFGAYSKADMESRIRWTSFTAREAEKRGIAWCYWEFCSGFGAYDPVKREWREGLLNALLSGKQYVSVESKCGSFSGAGWYEEGSYATVRVWGEGTGFPVSHVFSHFEGLGPNDRIIDKEVVEVYVDGPRVIRAVWIEDYTPVSILVIIVCAVLVVLGVVYYRRRLGGIERKPPLTSFKNLFLPRLGSNVFKQGLFKTD